MVEDLPIITVSEFNMTELSDFKARFNHLLSSPKVKEIVIEISSYGGEVHALFGMIDCIEASCKPVHLVGTGIIASAGATLLASGKKGFRYIGANTSMHIHPMQVCSMGDVPSITQETKTSNRLNNILFKKITRNSNINVTDLKKILKENNQEWLFTAKEALAYGFVDFIGIPRYETTVSCQLKI
jgi:ATP-dependent Clp protease protease subunit